jgi:hypothetical protein
MWHRQPPSSRDLQRTGRCVLERVSPSLRQDLARTFRGRTRRSSRRWRVDRAAGVLARHSGPPGSPLWAPGRGIGVQAIRRGWLLRC